MTELIFIGFLFGASLGSFLNVCAYRIPRHISIVRGRSFCPSCKRSLWWFELIPLISFLLSRGRCRTCHVPISLQYPLVESLSGATVVLMLLRAGLSWEVLLILVFTLSMLLVALIDWQYLLIPNQVLLWSLGLAFALKGASDPMALGEALLTLTISFGVLLLIRLSGNMLLGKESIGMGDVKLAAFIGFVLGVPGLLLSLWLGAVGGLLYGALRPLGLKRKTHGGEGSWHGGVRIPFGSFLSCSAALLALLETITQDFISLPRGVPWLSY